MNDPVKEVNGNDIINSHLGFAMVAGAIPFPVIDVLAVTAIQIDMLAHLARNYEIDFDKERGKSIVSSLVGSTIGSFLGRAGASAVKGIPGIGTLLGIGSQVILSGASTYAIGKAFQGHFQNNGNLFNINLDEMKKKFEEFLKQGETIAKEKEKHQTKEDIMDKIAKLGDLKNQGVLSEEEFAKTKADLLAKLVE